MSYTFACLTIRPSERCPGHDPCVVKYKRFKNGPFYIYADCLYALCVCGGGGGGGGGATNKQNCIHTTQLYILTEFL